MWMTLDAEHRIGTGSASGYAGSMNIPPEMKPGSPASSGQQRNSTIARKGQLVQLSSLFVTP